MDEVEVLCGPQGTFLACEVVLPKGALTLDAGTESVIPINWESSIDVTARKSWLVVAILKRMGTEQNRPDCIC